AESLDKAIVRIMSGRQYLSPDIEGQMQNKDFDSETLGLSTREFEVLRLLAEGRTVGQIAVSLDLSPKTVSNHRSHLMKKLKLTSTADLVRFAIRQGVIDA
ncbi:MAG: response regulator transcription factor, partial [Gammaproteobacteria bacterium]|nr:response regulator transcription factor [Gammaproteobacteria bacterium]